MPWLPDRAYCNVLDAASDGVSSLPVFEVPDSAKHFLEAGVHRLVNTGEPGLLFLHAASNNGTPELQELLNGFDRTAFKHVGLDDWKQQLSREQDPEVVKWLAEGARAPKNGGNEEKVWARRILQMTRVFLFLLRRCCDNGRIHNRVSVKEQRRFFAAGGLWRCL